MKLFINLLKTPTFLFGSILFTLTILLALVFPIFYHIDIVTRVGVPYMPPSLKHLMGTDHLGVDFLSLLITGLRSSLFVGLLAGTIATCTGTFLGVYAGYKGGWIDDFINLVTNLFLVIPSFLVLILISSSLEEGRSLHHNYRLHHLDMDNTVSSCSIIQFEKPGPH